MEDKALAIHEGKTHAGVHSSLPSCDNSVSGGDSAFNDMERKNNHPSLFGSGI